MNVYVNRHVLTPSHGQVTQVCLPIRQACVPYDISRSLSYLFYRFEKFVGGFSLFGHLNLISICKKDSLGVTEDDALGISVAVITFNRHLFFDIKKGMIERTGHNASLTSNA
jgi:hypothetical protein